MNRLMKILWPLSIAALVIQAVYYHPLLSERIASHFDIAGHPDDWSSKESFFLFWGFTILFLNVWVPLVGLLIRKLPPSMINVPHREYWLATPERKAYVLDMAFALMAGIFTGVNLLLGMVFRQLARFNLGQSSELEIGFFWVILAAIIAYAVVASIMGFRIGKENDGRYRGTPPGTFGPGPPR